MACWQRRWRACAPSHQPFGPLRAAETTAKVHRAPKRAAKGSQAAETLQPSLAGALADKAACTLSSGSSGLDSTTTCSTIVIACKAAVAYGTGCQLLRLGSRVPDRKALLRTADRANRAQYTADLGS